MSILNQNLLTLDFWQDKVTYAGHTLPTGSIGCAAMNIADEQIGELMQLAIPLAAVVELIKAGTPAAEHFAAAKGSGVVNSLIADAQIGFFVAHNTYLSFLIIYSTAEPRGRFRQAKK